MHIGICGSHIGGITLEIKLLIEEYYWPGMLRDNVIFINQCDKFKRYTPFIHSPIELLHSIISLWPFYKSGVNILDPFPLASGQLKFILLGVEYFTKWVEVKAVAKIMVEIVQRFY